MSSSTVSKRSFHPPDSLGHKPSDQALDKARDFAAKATAASREVERLETKLRRAVDQREDSAALSAALLAGEPDPGSRLTDGIRAELAEAKRIHEGLRRAAVTCREEARAVVLSNADAIAAAHAKAIDSARETARTALATASEAIATLHEHEAVVAWARDPFGSNLPDAKRSTQITVAAGGGVTLDAGSFLEAVAVAVDAEPADAEQQPEPAEVEPAA